MKGLKKLGIFPNYEKSGPGIDKNAPKKRGIFLYFELLGRYFWKFIRANMLYVAVSLPIAILYHYMFLCIFGTFYGESADLSLVNQSALTFTVLLTILWGTGPTSCGFTHILRSMAREEHVWISLDFFGKSKESFKHGLVFWLTDMAIFLVSAVSIRVYTQFAEQKSILFLIPLLIIIVMLFVYTLMHFFLYELEITFRNKLKEIYKNAFLLSLATLPMGILIGGIICLLSYFILGVLGETGIVVIAFLIWVGAMRFMIDLYSARYIKKHFLDKTQGDLK